jgi:hypothetical protein
MGRDAGQILHSIKTAESSEGSAPRHALLKKKEKFKLDQMHMSSYITKQMRSSSYIRNQSSYSHSYGCPPGFRIRMDPH